MLATTMLVFHIDVSNLFLLNNNTGSAKTSHDLLNFLCEKIPDFVCNNTNNNVSNISLGMHNETISSCAHQITTESDGFATFTHTTTFLFESVILTQNSSEQSDLCSSNDGHLSNITTANPLTSNNVNNIDDKSVTTNGFNISEFLEVSTCGIQHINFIANQANSTSAEQGAFNESDHSEFSECIVITEIQVGGDLSAGAVQALTMIQEDALLNALSISEEQSLTGSILNSSSVSISTFLSSTTQAVEVTIEVPSNTVEILSLSSTSGLDALVGALETLTQLDKTSDISTMSVLHINATTIAYINNIYVDMAISEDKVITIVIVVSTVVVLIIAMAIIIFIMRKRHKLVQMKPEIHLTIQDRGITTMLSVCDTGTSITYVENVT
jgi:hypothetical protein